MVMYASLLFRNALIVDGTGAKPYQGMVAVTEGTIGYAGPQGPDIHGEVEFDLQGKYLVPGFIDMHGHSDLYALGNPAMHAKIAQGITTEVIGDCGMGVYPVSGNPGKRELLSRMATDILGEAAQPWPWHDAASYLAQAEACGVATHLIVLQAHAPLRIAALEGNPNRPATPDEISCMVRMLNEAYDQGAAGFSTGLYYAPCLFASHEELSALLDVTAKRDRLFSVHHRCEGDDVIRSLTEVLELALQAKVRTEISHLKVIGGRNQHLVPQILSLLESYAEQGLEVGFDQYPYTYGSTSLYSLLPPDYLRLPREALLQALQDPQERREMRRQMEDADGWDSIVSLCGWDAISVMHVDGCEQHRGKSLAELAGRRDPFDLLFDILAEGPQTAVMADITQLEQSLMMIMQHPMGCFGTDALYSGVVRHPRSFRAANHLFTRYLKELETLSLERMVARMTGESARRLRLEDRGVLAKGYKADLVVLDIDSMEDVEGSNKGFPLVVVDGRIVVDQLRSRTG